MNTSNSFTKNNLKSFSRPGWRDAWDPGVEDVKTRILMKPEQGCGAAYLPCPRRFYALFPIIIRRNTCFFSTNSPLCSNNHFEYEDDISNNEAPKAHNTSGACFVYSVRPSQGYRLWFQYTLVLLILNPAACSPVTGYLKLAFRTAKHFRIIWL